MINSLKSSSKLRIGEFTQIHVYNEKSPLSENREKSTKNILFLLKMGLTHIL